ncbi:MAG: hypothetical protein JO225_11570 [Candidatus Eremiobacteraeota bacterium]|nr:hypothetical protein [Candidatus Eremiobacteraeota bacterium]
MSVRAYVLAATVLLVACGGGAQSALSPAAPNTTAPVPSLTGQARFTITVPKAAASSATRRPAYISPSTQSITVTTSGPTILNQTANLTPTSTGCSSTLASTQCVLSLALLPGSYTATITTYDQTGGTGNVLSSGQNVAFTIVAGTANTVALTLSGVPTSYLVATTSALVSGSMAGGFSIAGINQSPQGFIVEALDADGNAIVGPGSPTYAVSVVSGAGWTTSNPTASKPSVFTVTSPGSGVPATIKVTASYSDATCSLPAAVCSTTFTYANHAQKLFVAQCGSKCAGIGSDEVLIYAPPYTGAPAVITTAMNGPDALGMDGNANLFVANSGNNSVVALAPPYTGAPIYNFATVLAPDGIAFDADSNLFVSGENGQINEYAFPYSSLLQNIVSSSDPMPPAVLDGTSHLYLSENSGITQFAPSQYTLATAQINLPGSSGCTKVSRAGVVYFTLPVAGAAEIAQPPYAGFTPTDGNGPFDVTFDSKGNEFTNDADGSIREFAPSGSQIRTILGSITNFAGTNLFQCQYLTMDAADDLFVMENGAGTIAIYQPPYTSAPITLIGHGIVTPQGIFLGP